MFSISHAQLERSVWNTVDRLREEYVGLLQKMVQASAGGEEATQNHIHDLFAASGCDSESIRYDPRALNIPFEEVDPDLICSGERVNIVGKMAGADAGRSVLFWAHPDSSPVTGTQKWQHPPFAGIIEGGRLYGWGASDDLQGIAIMACALRAVVATGLQPKGTVILASTPSKQYAQGIISVLDAGYTADASIYLHPAESGAGLEDIKAVTCGSITFRIRVPGQPPATNEPGHTIFSHSAINPIEKAMLIYQALQELDKRRNRRIRYPLLEEAIGHSTSLSISHIHCGDPDRLNTISAECILSGVIIFPPGESAGEVAAEIVAAISQAAQEDEWLRNHEPEIEWLRTVSRGTEVSESHPLYQTVEQAITSVTGVRPRNYPLHTGSDIRNPMLYRDIPTLGLGPLSGDSTQIGGSDEWVDIEDYLRAVKVAASIIVNWCGVG